MCKRYHECLNVTSSARYAVIFHFILFPPSRGSHISLCNYLVVCSRRSHLELIYLECAKKKKKKRERHVAVLLKIHFNYMRAFSFLFQSALYFLFLRCASHMVPTLLTLFSVNEKCSKREDLCISLFHSRVLRESNVGIHTPAV